MDKRRRLHYLGNIDHKNTTCIENGEHWFYRAIKKEAIPKKIIKISRSELTDFLNIAKATFGIFVVKSMDGTKRYFLMHIVFRRYDSWRQQQYLEHEEKKR
jgi:hypothetical protein